MANLTKQLSWKGYAALVGGAMAVVVWSVTLYFQLVATRVLDSPWVL